MSPQPETQSLSEVVAQTTAPKQALKEIYQRFRQEVTDLKEQEKAQVITLEKNELQSLKQSITLQASRDQVEQELVNQQKLEIESLYKTELREKLKGIQSPQERQQIIDTSLIALFKNTFQLDLTSQDLAFLRNNLPIIDGIDSQGRYYALGVRGVSKEIIQFDTFDVRQRNDATLQFVYGVQYQLDPSAQSLQSLLTDPDISTFSFGQTKRGEHRFEAIMQPEANENARVTVFMAPPDRNDPQGKNLFKNGEQEAFDGMTVTEKNGTSRIYINQDSKNIARTLQHELRHVFGMVHDEHGEEATHYYRLDKTVQDDRDRKSLDAFLAKTNTDIPNPVIKTTREGDKSENQVVENTDFKGKIRGFIGDIKNVFAVGKSWLNNMIPADLRKTLVELPFIGAMFKSIFKMFGLDKETGGADPGDDKFDATLPDADKLPGKAIEAEKLNDAQKKVYEFLFEDVAAKLQGHLNYKDVANNIREENGYFNLLFRLGERQFKVWIKSDATDRSLNIQELNPLTVQSTSLAAKKEGDAISYASLNDFTVEKLQNDLLQKEAFLSNDELTDLKTRESQQHAAWMNVANKPYQYSFHNNMLYARRVTGTTTDYFRLESKEKPVEKLDAAKVETEILAHLQIKTNPSEFPPGYDKNEWTVMNDEWDHRKWDENRFIAHRKKPAENYFVAEKTGNSWIYHEATAGEREQIKALSDAVTLDSLKGKTFNSGTIKFAVSLEGTSRVGIFNFSDSKLTMNNNTYQLQALGSALSITEITFQNDGSLMLHVQGNVSVPLFGDQKIDKKPQIKKEVFDSNLTKMSKGESQITIEGENAAFVKV